MKHGFKPANVLLASFIRGVTRDPINRAQFFFSSENTPYADLCSGVCGRRGGCCGIDGARRTNRNTQFSESADMMPDHPLPLVLVESWHPLVLIGWPVLSA